MSRYDGLIIPRSYSEYINKTDAATLQQALQLSGVLSGAVAAGDNKAVTSNAVNNALADYDTSTEVTEKIGYALAEYKYYSIKADNAPNLDALNWESGYYARLPIPNDVNEILMCTIYGFTQTNKGLRYQLAVGQDDKSLYVAKVNKNDTVNDDEKIGYKILYR